MNRKKTYGLIILALLITLFLNACSNNKNLAIVGKRSTSGNMNDASADLYCYSNHFFKMTIDSFNTIPGYENRIYFGEWNSNNLDVTLSFSGYLDKNNKLQFYKNPLKMFTKDYLKTEPIEHESKFINALSSDEGEKILTFLSDNKYNRSEYVLDVSIQKQKDKVFNVSEKYEVFLKDINRWKN